MTDFISNELYITQDSKNNIGNKFDDKEDLIKTLQHLPENPEEINKQAEKIKKQKEKEAKEMPRKKIEKKRKAAAIKELEKWGMKTEENVAKINAIQFLSDRILIGKTAWAYENMIWGEWKFKQQTNNWYYDFEERKEEAEKQWIVLPEKKDFEDTFKTLDLEKDNRWMHILAIILWASKTGCLDNFGNLKENWKFGYLGLVSEYNEICSRYFRFDESRWGLGWINKNIKLICRPLVKEVKEVKEKSLEFEKDMFRINSEWWKEVTDKDKDNPILCKFVWKEPKVKVNT